MLWGSINGCSSITGKNSFLWPPPEMEYKMEKGILMWRHSLYTQSWLCIWAERKGRKLNTLIICGTFREQKKTYTGRAAAPITNGEIGERGHFTFVFLLSTKWQYVIPVAITAMNGFFHSHKCTKTLKDWGSWCRFQFWNQPFVLKKDLANCFLRFHELLVFPGEILFMFRMAFLIWLGIRGFKLPSGYSGAAVLSYQIWCNSHL